MPSNVAQDAHNILNQISVDCRESSDFALHFSLEFGNGSVVCFFHLDVFVGVCCEAIPPMWVWFQTYVDGFFAVVGDGDCDLNSKVVVPGHAAG
jgi:hypothetical protein